MKWGHTSIFPNQYIILLGPSGRARKSEPIEVCKYFLNQLGNVSMTSEAVTRQQLIRRMKNAQATVNLAPGYKSQCSMTCIAGELAAFLGEGDTQFLVDLTDWYDSREKWTYDTKHEGTDTLLGVCFNLLGAMAPDWIPHCIPQGAIGGGFTSRLLWVVAHHKERIISNPNEVELDKDLEAAILYDLERIHLLEGEVKFHPEALADYEAWYRAEEAKVSRGELPVRDPRFAGYISRRATHVKKIAMCLAVAEHDDLLIYPKEFKAAVADLEDLEKDMHTVFASVGTSGMAAELNAVQTYILERGVVSQRDLVRAFQSELNPNLLGYIEKTLEVMETVTIERDSKTGKVTYRANPSKPDA